jgi:hypothetical protein
MGTNNRIGIGVDNQNVIQNWNPLKPLGGETPSSYIKANSPSAI